MRGPWRSWARRCGAGSAARTSRRWPSTAPAPGLAYRKMWLGAAESERFAPGDRPAVHDVDCWRLGLAICRDIGVEQHAADTAALGIDAYVAGTVKSADEAARQDERARRAAVDPRVWVAVASFAGSTGGGYAPAAGRLAVWSPDGEAVARAGPQAGAIARATLIGSRVLD
jgi:predicted amidohydrolase